MHKGSADGHTRGTRTWCMCTEISCTSVPPWMPTLLQCACAQSPLVIKLDSRVISRHKDSGSSGGNEAYSHLCALEEHGQLFLPQTVWPLDSGWAFVRGRHKRNTPFPGPTEPRGTSGLQELSPRQGACAKPAGTWRIGGVHRPGCQLPEAVLTAAVFAAAQASSKQ